MTRTSIQAAKAKAKRFHWTRVDQTTDADVRSQAERDRDTAPVLTKKQILSDIKSGRARIVRPPHDVNVRAIRKRFGLSQQGFAHAFGFTPSAIKQWEQGRRKPEGAARSLLRIIDREPDAVKRALAE
jgi:putative transcriptional regulator